MQGFGAGFGWAHPLLPAPRGGGHLVCPTQWVYPTVFRGSDPPQPPHSPRTASPALCSPPFQTPGGSAAPRPAGLPRTVPNIQWACPVRFRGSDTKPHLLSPTSPARAASQTQPQNRVPAGGHPLVRPPLRGAHLG
ncbi:hypothetical protein T484DRAFT_3043128 [Baffinella frigidus]|nr:hypothetical protein T484DRAFT_3043128 [Cryptophyta sp. CCMP2293]